MRIFLINFLLTYVVAHMQLQIPPPRLSMFNPYVVQANIDYNMMVPLNSDGSNFPCKKYTAGHVVATYTAGETILVEAYGTATHGGMYDEKLIKN